MEIDARVATDKTGEPTRVDLINGARQVQLTADMTAFCGFVMDAGRKSSVKEFKSSKEALKWLLGKD